jgi:uncharacterized membrane protein
MNFTDRVPLDLVMVAVALLAAILYVFTGRPWYQTGILLLIACVWASEVAILTSHLAERQTLYARTHPVFAAITSIAVIVLYLLRRFKRA